MKYLGIKSPITLRSYIKSGLPVITIGSSKKISVTAIDKFMADHQQVIIERNNKTNAGTD
jgi:hypothetical protein